MKKSDAKHCINLLFQMHMIMCHLRNYYKSDSYSISDDDLDNIDERIYYASLMPQDVLYFKKSDENSYVTEANSKIPRRSTKRRTLRTFG